MLWEVINLSFPLCMAFPEAPEGAMVDGRSVELRGGRLSSSSGVGWLRRSKTGHTVSLVVPPVSITDFSLTELVQLNEAAICCSTPVCPGFQSYHRDVKQIALPHLPLEMLLT